MSVELFFKLKEIDSLCKMKNNYIKAKEEQENRVSKLNERRQENLLQTAKLKQDLVTIHGVIAEMEKNLKTASEQKQRLMDIGSDEKKIALYAQEITILEERGFELLTQLESIETELAENKTFLAGLENTIQEIQNETAGEIEKLNQEIINTDLRINLLQDELPVDYQSLLLKTTAKKLAHGPFTRVDQGSCFFCRFKLSRTDESEIDMQKNLKVCSQCDRIFLPYGA